MIPWWGKLRCRPISDDLGDALPLTKQTLNLGKKKIDTLELNNSILI